MRTIYLLRHAKSSWHDPGLADFDRPLNPRGMRAGPVIGGYFENNGYRPELILCSASRRTLETLSLVKPFIDLATPTLIEDGLYLASAGTILERLQSVDDAYRSAMVIAHNPGLEDAVGLLRHPDSAVDLPDKFPTAALAVFKAPIERWAELRAHSAKLTDLAKPRDFDGD